MILILLVDRCDWVLLANNPCSIVVFSVAVSSHKTISTEGSQVGIQLFMSSMSEFYTRKVLQYRLFHIKLFVQWVEPNNAESCTEKT